jgi:hypothetical protein
MCVVRVLWVLDCVQANRGYREASEVPRFCSTIPTAAAMIAFLTAGKTLTYPPSGALVVDVRRMYRRTYRENTCKENDGSHFTCVNKKTREHCAHKMRGSPRKVGGESIFKRPSPRFSCGSN